jgi:hypothetical protein
LTYFSAGLRDELQHGYDIGDHTQNHAWLARLNLGCAVRPDPPGGAGNRALRRTGSTPVQASVRRVQPRDPRHHAPAGDADGPVVDRSK